MRFRPDPDQAALELAGQMPLDVIEDLEKKADDEPLVKQAIQHWITRERLKADTATTEAMTRLIRSRTAAWKAIAENQRAKREAQTVKRALDREEQLAEAEHEATMRGIDVTTAKHDREYDQLTNPLQAVLDDAVLSAEINKLARSDEPLDQWHDALKLWKSGVKGQDYFMEETDRDINADYERDVNAVPPDAPNRDDLLREAGRKRDRARRRRDRLAASMAQHLAQAARTRRERGPQ